LLDGNLDTQLTLRKEQLGRMLALEQELALALERGQELLHLQEQERLPHHLGSSS
jgi:hypothetical protein